MTRPKVTFSDRQRATDRRRRAILRAHRDIDDGTQSIGRGPVQLDVLMARELGWSERKINRVWQQLDAIARRNHRGVGEPKIEDRGAEPERDRLISRIDGLRGALNEVIASSPLVTPSRLVGIAEEAIAQDDIDELRHPTIERG